MQKVVKDRTRRQDQNGAEKRTAPKSDDNSADITSQSFASQISELTKSIKDSPLALINHIEALEKQEKHKSVVRNNERDAQASCSFSQFCEEEQESLRDDDMIDPPAKKQNTILILRKISQVFFFFFFLPKETRSLMTSMHSF